MMKRFAMLVLIFTLLLSAVAEAKFSDEYKAKYPRRVKTETRIEPNGKTSQKTEYTFFDRRIGNGGLRLTLTDAGLPLRICTITFWQIDSYPEDYTKISWGDGNESHDLKMITAYSERNSRNNYTNFILVGIPFSTDLQNATVFSAHHFYTRDTIINQSHKRWGEWMEALSAANKIMNEQ